MEFSIFFFFHVSSQGGESTLIVTEPSIFLPLKILAKIVYSEKIGTIWLVIVCPWNNVETAVELMRVSQHVRNEFTEPKNNGKKLTDQPPFFFFFFLSLSSLTPSKRTSALLTFDHCTFNVLQYGRILLFLFFPLSLFPNVVLGFNPGLYSSATAPALFYFYFQSGSHEVVKAGLEFVTLLLQPPKSLGSQAYATNFLCLHYWWMGAEIILVCWCSLFRSREIVLSGDWLAFW